MAEVVVITGTRRWSMGLVLVVRQVLAGVREKHGDRVVLFHGGATGADEASDALAEGFGWQRYPLPYLKVAGKAGGPIRNEMMLAAAVECADRLDWPMKLYAFPDSKSVGTLRCIDSAKARGIDVVRSFIGAATALLPGGER